ncbi:hypothetical protein INR79_01625 [Vibrio sp. SCSIO 43132]|uniref:hypothetical protein n=1 Tax=Vibrio TaxID=662 RepID=UPI0005FA5147|nr:MULTISPECIES: hypothetical protein [Vibrio]KJY81214.1 hypothetical protein TW74_02710 [Vibrio nigripulchritudo]UAB70653.1 hypothetical protein INR79_01625 [Vibrio sp. SCSIO 43132]
MGENESLGEFGWDILSLAADTYVEVEKAKAGGVVNQVTNDNNTLQDQLKTQKALAQASASKKDEQTKLFLYGGLGLLVLIVLLVVLMK